MRRLGDVEGVHVGAIVLDLFVAQGPPIDADFARPLQDRVVDVGHVLDVDHLTRRREPTQCPDERVELDERERVTEVGRVVRRYTAHVQLDRPFRHWFARGGQGVAQEQGHVCRSELTILRDADVPRG